MIFIIHVCCRLRQSHLFVEKSSWRLLTLNTHLKKKNEFKVTIINFYKHCKLWNLDFLGKCISVLLSLQWACYFLIKLQTVSFFVVFILICFSLTVSLATALSVKSLTVLAGRNDWGRKISAMFLERSFIELFLFEVYYSLSYVSSDPCPYSLEIKFS